MRGKAPSPPALARIILTWCLPPGARGEALIGDLHEIYLQKATDNHPFGPTLWYWSQIVLLGLPFLVRRIVRRRLYRALANLTGTRANYLPARTLMADLGNDIRFALRSFVTTPGLTVSTTLILGIGIGSFTLMFSVLNTVVLRPLPFENPSELVWLWGTSERVPRNSISYADLLDLREGTEAFTSVAGFTSYSHTRILTGRSEAELVSVRHITANLFSTLGVQPEIGRAFVPEEELTAAEGVVVLSYALWQRQLGGSRDALGTVLLLDNQPVEVVGVLPRSFDLAARADLWVPAQPDAWYSQGRGNNNYRGVGRLKEGVSIDRAQAQLDIVAANIGAAHPGARAGWGVRAVSLHERYFGDTRHMLLILMGIVALVPVVACANAASLLLAKASARTKEMASRMAFGASRWRLSRQLLTESMLLAVVGGAVGLSVAWAGGTILHSIAPDALPRLEAIEIDATVLGFAILTSFMTVPLITVLPALKATDVRISEVLKVGGARGASARTRFRNGLVVAQVALSLTILFVSGLLLRSYRNLQTQDLGFQSEGLGYAEVELPSFKYENSAEVQADWEEIVGRLENVPGILSVGGVDQPPVTQWGPTNEVWAAERPPADASVRRGATRRYVTEDYFDVMRIPFVDGRPFEANEVGSAEEDPPVVINEALADQFFPGVNPVGKTLVFDYDVPRNLEIVGVVANTREGDPGTAALPVFFLPNRWRPRSSMTLFLRTQGNVTGLSASVRSVVRAVDSDIPPPTIEKMDRHVDKALFAPRFRSLLLTSFALVALMLTAVGLYGVMAFFVRSRTRELGIRVALGAQATGTAALVLRRGLALVGSGIVIGSAASLAAARAIQAWLFGVDRLDPITLGGVSLFLALVALVACILPAIRAMAVDPVETLREE